MERKRFSGVMLLFIVLAVVLITQVVGNLGRSGDVSYSDMRAYFTAEKVKSFTATTRAWWRSCRTAPASAAPSTASTRFIMT